MSEKCLLSKFKVIKVIPSKGIIQMENNVANLIQVQPTTLMEVNTLTSEDMVIKSNLIKNLSKCGVRFDDKMLNVVNVFFNDAQEYFNERQIKLQKVNAKLSQQIEKLKQQSYFEQGFSKSNDQQLLHGIRELGKSFLTNIEALFITDANNFQERKVYKTYKGKTEPKANNVHVSNDHKCKTLSEETTSALLEELTKRLGKPEEISTYKKELNKLFLSLMSFFDCLPNDMELPIYENGNCLELEGPTTELISDPNMGYQIDLPVIGQKQTATIEAPIAVTGKQINENSQAPKRNCVLDFNNYLHNCTVTISPAGDRPLHREVLNNNLLEVKRQCVVLKLQKISVDIFNDEDCTPLHLAMLHDVSPQIIETLFHYGAKFGLTDGAGNTLLHMGVENDTLGKLISCLDDANIKLAHKIVDLHNNEGFTALHLSAILGRSNIVRELIKFQANLDIVDKKSGRTALYHAIEGNHVEIVKILIKHDANAYVQTYGGTSIVEALYEAESDFSPDMKKLFYDDRMAIANERKENEKRPASTKHKFVKRQRKK